MGGFATLAKLSTARGGAAGLCVARSYRAQLAVCKTCHLTFTICWLPTIDGENHISATHTCFTSKNLCDDSF